MVEARKRILVIDDDEDFRISVRSLLESKGYTVFVAESGEEGLRKLVEHEPDLLVVDVMMETVEEGYGVIQTIRSDEDYAAFRSVPVIMVSCLEETPSERFPVSEAPVKYPDVYLTKPLDVTGFLEAVKVAAAGAQSGNR
jgi:CheY-like chemotaxis protein